MVEPMKFAFSIREIAWQQMQPQFLAAWLASRFSQDEFRKFTIKKEKYHRL
jgi:hypothetical protein